MVVGLYEFCWTKLIFASGTGPLAAGSPGLRLSFLSLGEILSMGLLRDVFTFAYNVPYSSVVFDVTRTVRESEIEDPRNIPLPTALEIYDRFVERLDGWAKGSVGLGKALYLASLNRIDEARRLLGEIERKFAQEPFVTQYFDLIRGYCDEAIANGKPAPLDQPIGR
jgi:hypothetical protein